MIKYVTIGTNDIEQGKRFYNAVFAVIGWKQVVDYGQHVGYGPDGSSQGQMIWICNPYDGQPARAGNGIMVGLEARSRAEVQALYATAMAEGGSDEGAPGPRENYGPDWYGAYFRDPTGNKLSIFHNKPA